MLKASKQGNVGDLRDIYVSFQHTEPIVIHARSPVDPSSAALSQ